MSPPSPMDAPSIELVPLGVADLRVTRLCFGTGTLFRLHSSRERQRLLDAAYALGIRHFDTARSYGLGDAEREVGRFVARHREHVSVATKFGMRLSRTGSLLKPLQTAARRVINVFTLMREQLNIALLRIAVQYDFTSTLEFGLQCRPGRTLHQGPRRKDGRMPSKAPPDSPRDWCPCDKPSRPEAKTKSIPNRSLFRLVQRLRFPSTAKQATNWK